MDPLALLPPVVIVGAVGVAIGSGRRRRAVRAGDTEDLEQLLAVTNARRRLHGLPERTSADAIREFEDR